MRNDSEKSISDSKRIKLDIESLRALRNKQIEKLRQELKRLISNLEYEQAAEKQNEIDALKNQGTLDELDYIKNEFSRAFHQNLDRYNHEEEMLRRDFERREASLRMTINKQYKLLQKEHRKQLSNLESDLVHDRELEYKRPIKEEIELKESSKHAAESGNFEEAVRLRDLSEDVARNNLQTRLDKLEEEFKSSRVALINKFEADIESLTTKLENDIANHRKSYGDNIDTLHANRDVGLGTLCSKYVKMCQDIPGDKGTNAVAEIQLIYVSKCKDYCIPPQKFQDDPNNKLLHSQKKKKTISESRFSECDNATK